MLIETGHIALIFALVLSVLQGTVPLWGAHRGDRRAMHFAARAAYVHFVLIAAAFASVTYAFTTSDFSLRLAAQHSHTLKPFLYKITGVWANHEGSMLLWVLILALYGALTARYSRRLPLGLRARALAVQGLISAAFLAFLIFTSNPFERLIPAPADGMGLNPILQDPGLAFHPPFLYLGYVGFSVPFAFAIAALLEGRVDAVWAEWLRPWVLTAWSFLTVGITLGSIWAYYELGWGGWWMWDPVENVSFLPWLAGTALLHSILVLSRRHIMAHWTVLLAITAFSLSLIGTFIVRSGVLVSVHAFAVDPQRGVVLLAILAAVTGGAFLLYALRSHTIRGAADHNRLSKETGLVLNNIFLIVSAATVALGTFYPLLVEAFGGDKLSVGAPYFDATFGPLMIVLIICMGVGPLIKWRADTWQRLRKAAMIAGAVFLLAALGIYIFGKSFGGAIGMGLSAYLFVGAMLAFLEKIGGLRQGAAHAWQRARRQPASTYAFLLAHTGMAIAAAGITAMSVWADENVKDLAAGESMNVGQYEFTLTEIERMRGANYMAVGAIVSVQKNNALQGNLRTQRRFYPVRGMLTSEAGIKVAPMRNLYVGLSEQAGEGRWIVRAYVHPMVCWIWAGALLMALGGFISLLGRRPARRAA